MKKVESSNWVVAVIAVRPINREILVMQKTVLTMSILAVALIAASQATTVFAGEEGSCASSCSKDSAKAAQGGSQCPIMKGLASLAPDKAAAAQPTEQAASGAQNVAAGIEAENESKESSAVESEKTAECKKAAECEKKENCDAKAGKDCAAGEGGKTCCKKDEADCAKKDAKAGCCAKAKACDAK